MSDKKQKDEDLEKYARQIWLAGLGAYTRLGKEGSKLFDALIRDGEDAEKLASKSSLEGARHKVEKARKKLGAKLDGWEASFDKRLQGAAERMGLASQADLQALTARLDELASAVEKFSAAPAAKQSGRAAEAEVAEKTAASAKPAARRPAAAVKKPAGKPSSTAAASKATAKSGNSAGVTTAPRRRTAPKAATRGKSSPAPATETAPGTPPEL